MTNNVDYSVYHDIIECLVGTIEAKDIYTNGHSERVADMAEMLGEKFGFTKSKLERLHMAAHLHDIGKIGIPDYILNKNGKLNEKEWLTIKKHPQIGYDILTRSSKLLTIAKIVLCHHERWDGNGYPNMIKAKDIPFESRIIAVCDTIDAMTSKRPYREPISWEICREEIEKNKGTQFDPKVVDAIKSLWSVFRKKFS
ncbi:HD-GYP domain-containing protein [Clostridium sediminicola]|uniref:HD-GYP domain-containing protein n=1 Tax=Clostridium sediminicola TaxID=3114879 RepID=UPI0031F21C03